MSDDVWISRPVYTLDEDGRPQSHLISVTQEIIEKREDLTHEAEDTTSFVLPTVRGLVLASVLDEVAARFRRTGGSSDEQIAELCDDMARDLRQRTGMKS
ncbi:MAG TPA: hypothetical protein VN408_26760 [Actinoplanes sp.]|nr:hypothetical protein [Actinoplanes sp.]